MIFPCTPELEDPGPETHLAAGSSTMRSGRSFWMARRLRRMVLGLVLIGGRVTSATPSATDDDTILEWNGSELTAGNQQLMRHWKLIDGLPSATSLISGQREWLNAENRWTTTLPAGWRLAPPVRVQWQSVFGRSNPVEAASRTGELTVLGANGVGYRWQIKVFPHCPAVLCQLEMIGPRQAAPD